MKDQEGWAVAIKSAMEWRVELDRLARVRMAGPGRRVAYPIDRLTGRVPQPLPPDLVDVWQTLSGSALTALAASVEEGEPPEASGVYALIEESRVVYVGQSTDLACRLLVHLGRRPCRATWARVPPHLLLTAERHLLDLLVPVANGDRRTCRLRAWLNQSRG